MDAKQVLQNPFDEEWLAHIERHFARAGRDHPDLARAIDAVMEEGWDERVIALSRVRNPSARYLAEALPKHSPPTQEVFQMAWADARYRIPGLQALHVYDYGEMGITDPLLAEHFHAHGLTLEKLRELRAKVVDAAVGCAQDNEHDSHYEGAIEHSANRHAEGEELPWFTHTVDEDDDGEPYESSDSDAFDQYAWEDCVKDDPWFVIGDSYISYTMAECFIEDILDYAEYCYFESRNDDEEKEAKEESWRRIDPRVLAHAVWLVSEAQIRNSPWSGAWAREEHEKA
jgi:hypothetical protein